MALGSIIPPEFLGYLDPYEIMGQHDQRSAFEQLFDEIKQHEYEEEAVLEDYERTATASSDPGVRYLINLILEDEVRHHKMSQDIVRDIRRSLVWWTGGHEVPTIEVNGAERQELLAKTRRYIHLEQQGIEQLARLEPKVKELRSGMTLLLFQLMEADSKKHIHILKYIEKHLEGQPK